MGVYEKRTIANGGTEGEKVSSSAGRFEYGAKVERIIKNPNDEKSQNAWKWFRNDGYKPFK